MEHTLYIRMRQRIQVKPNHIVRLNDLAQIIGPSHLKSKVENLIIQHVNMSDKNYVVIDVMQVVKAIHTINAEIEVQTVGAAQTIVEVIYNKRKATPLLFCTVWFLLFIGAALAIMNFHEDVSMQAVHQKLFFIITGKKEFSPLLLQVPYSIGLGMGMVLFFNHLFKKRINEEPSPLEVEMFNYQQDLDQYIVLNDNKESVKKLDDN